MKKSALLSAIFHTLLLVVLLVGIPMPQRRLPVNEKPIIIEFENIADISKAPILTPEASKEDKKTAKKSEPKSEPKKESEKPKEEPMPSEQKPQEIEKGETEIDPKDEVKEKPHAKSELKEKLKEKEVKPLIASKKKPEPKKETKKNPKKDKTKKDENPTKAEVNLDPKKTKPKPLLQEKEKSVDNIVDSLIDNTSDDGAKRGAPANAMGMEITATDIDAIRQRIYKCWLVPIGSQGAKDLIVDVKMDINQDGTVARAEVVNKGRMDDPAFQAAAESAQRAVLDPACNPLPLPPEKYEKWKRLTLRFNPKDMY